MTIQAPEPLVTAPPAVRCVGVGVDTLYVAWWAQLPLGLLEDLEDKKQEAAGIEQSGRTDTATTINIGGRRFAVAPHGVPGYPFRLVSEGEEFTVCVARSRRTESPSLYVRLSSRFLWEKGYLAAFHEVRDWAEALHEDTKKPRAVLSRIDLAADMTGIRPDFNDRAAFVLRARWAGAYFSPEARWSFDMTNHCWKRDDRQEVTKVTPNEAEDSAFFAGWSGRSFTGFRFGKSSIVFRIYDKLAEVKAGGSEKLWFVPIWAAKGWTGEPVWRFEAQLRREALRELPIVKAGKKQKDPDPEDVLRSLDSLWAYVVGAQKVEAAAKLETAAKRKARAAAKKEGLEYKAERSELTRGWISWRVPDASEPQPCRWEVREEWAALREVSFGPAAFPVVRAHRLNVKAEALEAMGGGCFATWCVCRGFKPKDMARAAKQYMEAARNRLGKKKGGIAGQLALKELRFMLAREAEIGWA